METRALSAARAHVFNKMPIRLLAFDKDGSNIRLIGRDQIFPSILPGVFSKIAEPKFKSAWAKAEVLEDSEYEAQLYKYRSNKMKELLTEVVEQSVDYAILSHTWLRDTPATLPSTPGRRVSIICAVTPRL